MSLGLVGRKVGMTRVFTDDGTSVPVTVIEVEPNRVSQIKTVETDGYVAVQVVTGSRRASRVTRPMAGHYKKAGVEAGRGAWEFRVDSVDELSWAPNSRLTCLSRARLLTLPVFPRVRASRVVSSVTTSECRMQPTATRFRIVPTVPSVRTRPRVAYSRARRCRATWVRATLLRKTWRSSRLISSVTCC